MAFIDDIPHYKELEDDEYYFHSVPSQAWDELEALIQSSAEDASELKMILIKIGYKVRYKTITDFGYSWLLEHISPIVSKLRKCVEERGRFNIFMDCLAILVDDGGKSIAEVNEYLEDNRIGYQGYHDRMGTYWFIIGEEMSDGEEAVSASESGKSDTEIVKEVSAQLREKTEEISNMSMDNMEIVSRPAKIFISHSSNDVEYMRAFTDLLNRIQIPAGSIVCTSIERHMIPNGENIFDWLRRQFIDYDLHMIFALSDNYYNSCVSLNEMGAAWVTATHKDLLLLPGFKFDDIKGCIDKNTAGISLDSEDKLLKARLGGLKNSLISEFHLNPILDIDWEEYRDQFIREVREIAKSKRLAKNQGLSDVGLVEDNVVYPRRQPAPKFEIKIERVSAAYSNLVLSIKNVSNVFVSGLKGISFHILDKLGEPYTYADHTPMPVPRKFDFKETSIASGEQTLVAIDTPMLYRQKDTANPVTGEEMRVALVPKDFNFEFNFICEDEYEEEYTFRAETVIPSANRLYRGIWKCKKME